MAFRDSKIDYMGLLENKDKGNRIGRYIDTSVGVPRVKRLILGRRVYSKHRDFRSKCGEK